MMPGDDDLVEVTPEAAASLLCLPAVTDSTTPLDAALAYLDAGFAPIDLGGLAPAGDVCTCQDGAECRKPGKHPRRKGWEQGNMSETDLRAAWRRDPRANVGLVMGGPLRLVALDVDGADGRAQLAAFEAAHGLLPVTAMALTGSGGEHRLFRCPDRLDLAALSNRVKVGGGTDGGLDVRAQGGQIVVAPSLHLSGRRYQWTNPGPIAELPEALYRLMVAESVGQGGQVAPTMQAPVAPPPRPAATAGQGRPDAYERARTYLGSLPAAVAGNGGSKAMLLAATRMVWGFGLSDDDAERLLWESYNPHCQPPWKPGEKDGPAHKVASARKRGCPPGHEPGWLLVEDRSWTPPPRASSRGAMPGSPSVTSNATRAVTSNASNVTGNGQGVTSNATRAVTSNAPSNAIDPDDAPASGVVPGGELGAEGEVETADPDALAFITADDLAADLDASKRRADGTDKPVPLPWPDVAKQLGGGLWPGLHILVGGSGVGKTTMALQIALEAAFQGHPTCYVGLELEPRQVRLRLLALHAGVPWSAVYTGKHLDGTDARPVIATASRLAPVIAGLPLAVEGARPEGWPASRLERVAEQLQRRYPDKPALIVLDFLQLLGPEKHNGRADLRERIGQAAYQARHVAKDYGAAVLAISSTARDKYDALGIGVDGKTARDQAHPAGIGVVAKGGVITRTMSNRDALIGMGKESGEVEYAADSVSVLLRWRDSAPGSGGVIFASPKVRVGVEGWCELAFNGTHYSKGNGSIAGAFAAYAAKSTKAAAAKSTNPPSSETDDDGDIPEGWGTKLCAGNFPHRNRPINGSGR